MIRSLETAGRGALLAVAWAGLALAGCSRNVVHLTILSTNDFHGALESTSKDPETGAPLGGGASLAATLRAERRANPAGTIYLDGGDSLHGTALSNLSKGRAVVELMNLLELDASVVGNHEFDFGVEELVARIGEAEYPILAANIVSKSGGEPPAWTTPYEIFELHGVRVAVIGLATVSTPLTTLPSNVEDLDFLDPATVVNRWTARLVPSAADLVVALGHIGVSSRDGRATAQGELLEMAEKLTGVAALVGGHTHQLFAGELAGIPAVEAAHSGGYLGRIDLRYNTRRRRVRSSRIRTVKILADRGAGEPEIRALVARYAAGVAEQMRQVIAVAAAPVERARDRESAMGNLVADGWRSQLDVDLVFQNTGGVRASFAAGPITYEDLYRVLPFENTVVTVEMTGAEIEQLLLQGAERAGRLEVSGLRYVVDASRLPAKVVSTEPALETDRLYRVAVNSFMAEGGDGLEILANRPEAVDTGLSMRDVVAAWLRAETAAGRKIRPVLDGRIQIISN